VRLRKFIGGTEIPRTPPQSHGVYLPAQHRSVSILADPHNLEAMALKIEIAGIENDSSACELLNRFEAPVRRAPSEQKMVR